MNFITSETTTVEVVDPITGERIIIGGTTTNVVIGPCGERAIVERELLARTNDQRIITARTEVFACGCGCNALPLLVRDSITFCEACRIPIAIAHAKTCDDGSTTAVVCPSCWQPGHRIRAIKRLLRWVLQP